MIIYFFNPIIFSYYIAYFIPFLSTQRKVEKFNSPYLSYSRQGAICIFINLGVAILLFCSQKVHAQNTSKQTFWQRYQQEPKVELATDRPDQTESSCTVPAGTFQLETGVLFESFNADGQKNRIFTYPTSLLRIGLLKNLELRIINDFAYTHISKENETIEAINGLSTLVLGTKIYICEEKGIRPEISLNTHVHLPVGHIKYRPKWTFPDFRFLFSHTLSRRLSLSYNLGYSSDGETAPRHFEYTLALGANLIDKLCCYVETYGQITETKQVGVLFDGGFTYLVLPLVQLDISSGFEATNPSDHYWFLSGGISFRLPK